MKRILFLTILFSIIGSVWAMRKSETIFPGATESPNVEGWVESEWYGWFYDGFYPWIYHSEHGWQFISSDDPDRIWTWSQSQRWVYTNKDLYPWIYDHNLSSNSSQSWVYYIYSEENQERWFHTHADGWITLSPDDITIDYQRYGYGRDQREGEEVVQDTETSEETQQGETEQGEQTAESSSGSNDIPVVETTAEPSISGEAILEDGGNDNSDESGGNNGNSNSSNSNSD